MVNIVALIPARSGSKGIPKKNIIEFRGKPLMGYSIDYAKNCSLINDIIVSTDSKQFCEIANKLGARTPFLRPSELSGDEVQDFPVVEHTVNFLEDKENMKIDYIALLRPTSPLRPPQLIEKAYNLMKANDLCTSVRTVIPSQQHPFRQFKVEDGKMISFSKKLKEPYNLPRQKLPQAFFQSGDLEFIRRSTISNGSVSGNFIVPLIINPDDILDIDNPKDLKF